MKHMTSFRILPAHEEIRRATEIFESQADEGVVSAARELTRIGAAFWRLDPHVSGVVGLTYRGTNQAAVVVYLATEDWETSLS